MKVLSALSGCIPAFAAALLASCTCDDFTERFGEDAPREKIIVEKTADKITLDGNLEEGSFMAGQIAGMIHDVKPCKEIIEEMFHDAENLIKNFEKIRGVTLG